MAVKRNMYKAYDIFDWDFLNVVMRQMDFSEKQVVWVMACLR